MDCKPSRRNLGENPLGVERRKGRPKAVATRAGEYGATEAPVNGHNEIKGTCATRWGHSP